jgi:hypothetical protein
MKYRLLNYRQFYWLPEELEWLAEALAKNGGTTTSQRSINTRILNCVNNAELYKREDIIAAMADGRLDPDRARCLRNYGHEAHRALCRVFGIASPEQIRRHNLFDPAMI